MSIEQESNSTQELFQGTLEYDIAKKQVLKDLDEYSAQVEKAKESGNWIPKYEGLDVVQFKDDPDVIIEAVHCQVITVDEEGCLSSFDLKDSKLLEDKDFVLKYVRTIKKGMDHLFKKSGYNFNYHFSYVRIPLLDYVDPSILSDKEFFLKVVSIFKEENLAEELFFYIHPEKIDKEVLSVSKDIFSSYAKCFECFIDTSRYEDNRVEENLCALYKEDTDFALDFFKKVFKDFIKSKDPKAHREILGQFLMDIPGIDDELRLYFSEHRLYLGKVEDAKTVARVAEEGLSTLTAVHEDVIRLHPDIVDKVVENAVKKERTQILDIFGTMVADKEYLQGVCRKLLSIDPSNFQYLPEEDRNNPLTFLSVFKVWPDALRFAPLFQSDFCRFALEHKNMSVKELIPEFYIYIESWTSRATRARYLLDEREYKRYQRERVVKS